MYDAWQTNVLEHKLSSSTPAFSSENAHCCLLLSDNTKISVNCLENARLEARTFAPWIADQVKRTIHRVADSTLRFLVLGIDVHFPPAYNRVCGRHNLRATDFVNKNPFPPQFLPRFNPKFPILIKTHTDGFNIAIHDTLLIQRANSLYFKSILL